MSDTYKPTGKLLHNPALLFQTTNISTDHDGLKQDGTPDKRVGTGEFAQGKVDPHEAGKQGGNTSGTGSSDSTSSSGNSGGSAKGREFSYLDFYFAALC
jgi:hypothetical protein